MKKSFILIVACVFAFIGAHAQSSDVEINSQKTKTEKFLAESGFVKGEQIHRFNGAGMEVLAKVFTDLKTGEKIAALEFWPLNLEVVGAILNGGKKDPDFAREPLGYLDMDYVDDLLKALEVILNEANSSSKKDVFSIAYTAPGGIDVYFASGVKKEMIAPKEQVVTFRKKWYGVNEYGQETYHYTAPANITVEQLAKLIPAIKEAQELAKQAIGQ